MKTLNKLNQVQTIEHMKKTSVANAIEDTKGKVNETLKIDLYTDVLNKAQDILNTARLEQDLANALNKLMSEQNEARETGESVTEMLYAPKNNVVKLPNGNKELNTQVPVGNTISLGQAANDNNYKLVA